MVFLNVVNSVVSAFAIVVVIVVAVAGVIAFSLSRHWCYKQRCHLIILES